MELIKGYVTVDPDTAFRMYESVIDIMNEYIHASATIAKFNAQTTTFKNGELTMKIGGSDFPLFRYIPQMQMLGKLDLERMNTLAGRFHRNDARAIVKLYVLQGFVKDEKARSPQPLPVMSGVIVN